MGAHVKTVFQTFSPLSLCHCVIYFELSVGLQTQQYQLAVALPLQLGHVASIP